LTTASRRLASAVILGALVLASGCREEEGSTEELCDAVAQGDFAGTFADFDPTDPETALDQLRAARVELGDLHDAAPGEVRDDLQVEIDYVQALIDALEGVEPGDAAESALQVHAVTDAHPEVDEAAANLAAFAEEEC
jgi:hypothetical protein